MAEQFPLTAVEWFRVVSGFRVLVSGFWFQGLGLKGVAVLECWSSRVLGCVVVSRV